MSILDEESKLIEQTDKSVNSWYKKKVKERHYNGDWEWMINGKRIKIPNPSLDFSDTEYVAGYKF